MIVFPNAKINIGLFITEKRSDRFHNIESIFYPIDWKDILEITPAKELSFKSSGIKIPGDSSSNLCLSAYHLLQKEYNLPPVSIHLHKIIPIGAGLGGGSSDAAFTIKALNKLFNLNLATSELETYAQQLGSDCTFFIQNKPNFCFGKGDEFSQTSLDLSEFWIKLIYPETHVSTQEAYAGIYPQPAAFDLHHIHEAFIHEWKMYIKNDFETSIFENHSFLENIKLDLYDEGAVYASMSGSGSTVYGLFKNKPYESKLRKGVQKIAKLAY